MWVECQWEHTFSQEMWCCRALTLELSPENTRKYCDWKTWEKSLTSQCSVAWTNQAGHKPYLLSLLAIRWEGIRSFVFFVIILAALHAVLHTIITDDMCLLRVILYVLPVIGYYGVLFCRCFTITKGSYGSGATESSLLWTTPSPV